jgi:hypothetical protein
MAARATIEIKKNQKIDFKQARFMTGLIGVRQLL